MENKTEKIEEEGILLKCPRTDCGNIWKYKGKNTRYAPCSKCRTSVSIKKNCILPEKKEKKE